MLREVTVREIKTKEHFEQYPDGTILGYKYKYMDHVTPCIKVGDKIFPIKNFHYFTDKDLKNLEFEVFEIEDD